MIRCLGVDLVINDIQTVSMSLDAGQTAEQINGILRGELLGSGDVAAARFIDPAWPAPEPGQQPRTLQLGQMALRLANALAAGADGNPISLLVPNGAKPYGSPSMPCIKLSVAVPNRPRSMPAPRSTPAPAPHSAPRFAASGGSAGRGSAPRSGGGGGVRAAGGAADGGSDELDGASDGDGDRADGKLLGKPRRDNKNHPVIGPCITHFKQLLDRYVVILDKSAPSVLGHAWVCTLCRQLRAAVPSRRAAVPPHRLRSDVRRTVAHSRSPWCPPSLNPRHQRRRASATC